MTGTDQNLDHSASAEIVVDLPYADLVIKRLHEMGAELNGNSNKSDPGLGLGTINVTNIEAVAAKIKELSPDEKYPPRTPSDTPLDKVLGELRRLFKNDNGGWTPEMGKNRTMYGVQGSPHIGTGGSGYPEPAMAVNLWPPVRNSRGRGTRIGLLDTKLSPAKEFDGHYIALNDSLLEPGTDYSHLAGHSAFSVGQILSRAPGAEVLIQGVLSDKVAIATVWEVATEMVRFADRDVSVLVLPLACYTRDGEAPLALQRAVDRLRNKVMVVAAAGNNGNAKPRVPGGESLLGRPAFPAACEGAIAVGAVDKENMLADFSPSSPWVQLVAPGKDVTSTFLSGVVTFAEVGHEAPEKPTDDFRSGFAMWSGTSFAAATIGGEIAARVIPNRFSAADVLGELLEHKPRQHNGIGGYANL